ncbi:zonadhesin-like [Mangifera indica]|uniref:zonadhesin-like n=1 Tax=Mangifera indica TaxID=29780 RepID=UPI001CFBE523|nr:zonadhesin-like [Mangifera indica]XP_044494126.1 zonadhesin-like [Mangifera indica]XP_044494871.1 zonadhesin-like [Mangifera indica]
MVMKERDEELALFLEMRRREKEKSNLNLLVHSSEDVNSNSTPLAPNNGGSPISKILSSVPTRKTAADNFLNSENDKSDYDWLLTPPGTPLFPSLETMESQKTKMRQIGMSNARPTALKTRLPNLQEEPASRSAVASKDPTVPSRLNSSGIANRRPSSSGGRTSATRAATPTRQPTLTTTAKPSRPLTPTSRATLPSSKPVASAVRSSTPTVRSSTPSRSTARSSTPTARPTAAAPKLVPRSATPTSRSTSRSATPTRRPSAPSSAPSVSAPPVRSSTVSKSGSTTSKNPVPSRGTSPTVKSRPWKPSEMPGFSLDAPPNLKTSLPERPASASRGRPGTQSNQLSSVEANSNGRRRQQSCSPSRVRTSSGSGSSIPFVRKANASSSDDVNPILMGTKMVERVVNMRKLVPPKQDNKGSGHNNSAGKSSSSLDSSGFGRSLSKKSLDMALRHMDIRRSIQGNLRPLMTNIPASSMYSVRSGSTKSVSDSPLATRSNASSEPSVNNNFSCLDDIEMECSNDFGSERGNSSPTSQRGR